MSKLFWTLGAITLGVAAYVVLNQPSGQLMPADGLEDTAGKIDDWGAKQQVTGTAGQLKGKVEATAGDLLDSNKLGNQGAFDQAAGAVQDAAGKAAGAIADAVRKLNQ